MPGTLFVVATPIGNLEDITLRALRVLREVSFVAAEDTRRTGNLLRHYQIKTPLISLHEHNERMRVAPIVERLQKGESIALVSDAGTPGISDPGAVLIKSVRDEGIRVEPVPGPSSVTAALSASGLFFERFAFAGFPPVRAKDRARWFEWVERLPDVPVVCFEAPHRVRRTLADMAKLYGKRQIIIARELTKAHEEWVADREDVPERGEFVIIIGQSTETGRREGLNDGSDRTDDAEGQPLDPARIRRIFGELTESGVGSTRRAVVKAVAERLGLPVKTVYDALERAKT